MQLGHILKADGRWRVFLFAGKQTEKLQEICAYLQTSSFSPTVKYTPQNADIDALIDVLAVYPVPHRELETPAIPALLRPRKGRYSLVDYEKILCPDAAPGKDIYDLRGIDRTVGCMVIVRPDQFVADVLPFNASTELAAFFDNLLLEPTQGNAWQAKHRSCGTKEETTLV